MTDRWIDKIEVVRRQLIEAIRLFFEQRDPVAIHTLVASAHQILVDLGRLKGISSNVKGIRGLDAEAARARLKLLNGPYNFFKHADNDPEAKLFVGPLEEFASDFIMDACVLLQGVASDLPMEAKTFWMWYVSKHPSEFPDDGELGKMKQQRLADWDFPTIRQFLKFGEIVGDLPIVPRSSP